MGKVTGHSHQDAIPVYKGHETNTLLKSVN